VFYGTKDIIGRGRKKHARWQVKLLIPDDNRVNVIGAYANPGEINVTIFRVQGSNPGFFSLALKTHKHKAEMKATQPCTG
jgi:hypothetical protein